MCFRNLTKNKSCEELDRIYGEKNKEFGKCARLKELLLHGEEIVKYSRILIRGEK